jgi:hypothetical protein
MPFELFRRQVLFQDQIIDGFDRFHDTLLRKAPRWVLPLVCDRTALALKWQYDEEMIFGCLSLSRIY